MESTGAAAVRGAARAVASARRRGDPDALARALTLHAEALVDQGKLAAARRDLDEAAQIHRERGRPQDEARCSHLAATLCRLDGRLPEARERAVRAAALAGSGNPVAVSAATELAEIALAEGHGDEAARAYATALDEGRRAGLIAPAQAALLRRRATALVLAGRHEEAAAGLSVAHGLLSGAGAEEDAVRTLVERASALHEGRLPEAEEATASAMEAARQAGDEHALADLYLLAGARALGRNDPGSALELARRARDHALAARAPVSYIGAAVAIARLSEDQGDPVGAYEALATGWATLSDLLGRDAAKAAFQPPLLALRERLGPEGFAQARARYEAARRQAMGHAAGPARDA